ncbi:hypothetical protein E2320_006819, partial [Naja naja]
ASARALRGAWGPLGAGRGFRSSAAVEKCQAGRVRPRKGNQPVTYQDPFILGTFHGCLADEIVLKRRANTVIICAILLQNLPPHRIYFLVGYTEVLLSFFYKCPVKMELQTISEKIIYKYL